MQPFVDADHFIQSFFPHRYWAVAVPSLLLVVGITIITSLVSLVMLRADREKKAKAVGASMKDDNNNIHNTTKEIKKTK